MGEGKSIKAHFNNFITELEIRSGQGMLSGGGFSDSEICLQNRNVSKTEHLNTSKFASESVINVDIEQNLKVILNSPVPPPVIGTGILFESG